MSEPELLRRRSEEIPWEDEMSARKGAALSVTLGLLFCEAWCLSLGTQGTPAELDAEDASPNRSGRGEAVEAASRDGDMDLINTTGRSTQLGLMLAVVCEYEMLCASSVSLSLSRFSFVWSDHALFDRCSDLAPVMGLSATTMKRREGE